MYILIGDGEEIKAGDESFTINPWNDFEMMWVPVKGERIGSLCDSDNDLPIRRKIESVKELVDIYPLRAEVE